MKVASYNIQKSIGTDFRRQPQRILAILNDLDADVIALQEVDLRFGNQRRSSLPADLIASETGYRALRFGARPESLGWHGNVLLVKRSVEVLHQRQIELPALEPRGAVLADLAVGDERVRIVGMHLGLVGLWRKRQALALLSQLDALEHRLPTVMLGDLNEWTIEGGCLRHFAADHTVCAPGASFPSMRPMLTFDRIITTPDIDIIDSGVHDTLRSRKASDHLPVWATIRLKAAGVRSVAA